MVAERERRVATDAAIAANDADLLATSLRAELSRLQGSLADAEKQAGCSYL
jgi:hypothetical protein